MKIREFFCFNKSEDKYDVAIRSCYIISFVIGFIVFISNGLEHMRPEIWLLAFAGSAFGAVAFGTFAKSIINMVQSSRQEGGKVQGEQLLKHISVIAFSLATIGFFSSGIKQGNLMAWIISFIGAYGGATIATALVRVIYSLARKDD